MICAHFGPGLVRWARESSEFVHEDFAGKYNTLPEWGEDVTRPALKQVEAFACAACVVSATTSPRLKTCTCVRSDRWGNYSTCWNDGDDVSFGGSR